MGHIHRPKLKSGGKCGVWWVKYFTNGRCVRESASTKSEQQARRVLKDRKGRAVSGQPVLPRVDKIRYDEVAEDLRAYYRTTGKRNLTEAGKRLKHLDGYFKARRVVAIDPPRITEYVAWRQAPTPATGDEPAKAGAANGTINRELAILSRMLRLAYENGKLVRVPIIRKLKEADPRSGFFGPEQFESVRKRLPDDLQAALTVAYTFGWRMQSEVLALERRHLDLDTGTLCLDPGMTKNGKGRVVYLTPELKGSYGPRRSAWRVLSASARRQSRGCSPPA